MLPAPQTYLHEELDTVWMDTLRIPKFELQMPSQWETQELLSPFENTVATEIGLMRVRYSKHEHWRLLSALVKGMFHTFSCVGHSYIPDATIVPSLSLSSTSRMTVFSVTPASLPALQ